MGSFFTSTQIHNHEQLNKERFTEFFCNEMKNAGYEICNSDESELSYILRFADNCNWVTITSEAYDQGNQLSKQDTGRIAKMLKTTCINTIVIDSDCAIMEMYNKNGQKADALIMGRADDYFGDNIPQPSKKIWSQFLSNESTWKQFTEVCNENEIFVEDSLSKLAETIGMHSHNILFSFEDSQEDEQNIFLDFKKVIPSITISQNGKIVDKVTEKLTLSTAFKQIIGKALEPYGFKVIKGRHPYIVRVVNNEILHIITFRSEIPKYPKDKAFAIMGGIATIYRKKITLDLSPKQNYGWLKYMYKFYDMLVAESDVSILDQLHISRYYSERPESLISVLNNDAETLIKYVLPVMENVNNIESCLNYMQKIMQPCNYLKCTEICSYYPDEDESFLYFLSTKENEECHDFLDNFKNDTKFHNWVMLELEKRKNENIEILKSYDLYDNQEGM